MGQQINQITNQSRALALHSEARSRLNTVYMTCTFVGGALGSLGGSWAWSSGGIEAVCALSFTLVVIASLGLAVIGRGAKPAAS